jgi:hypothetical protein
MEQVRIFYLHLTVNKKYKHINQPDKIIITNIANLTVLQWVLVLNMDYL